MTSHELARKLLSMEDLPVTISGYEGGVDIVESVNEPGILHTNVHDEWYYGKHEYCNMEKILNCFYHEGKEIRAIHIQ